MRALLIAAALVLTPVAALAQTLTVTNADGKVTTLTQEALAALPQAEARLGGKTVYVGASLTAILREAGVPQGPRLHGKPMQAFIVVTGKDGYRGSSPSPRPTPASATPRSLSPARRRPVRWTPRKARCAWSSTPTRGRIAGFGRWRRSGW